MSTEDKKKPAQDMENALQEQYVQSLQPIEEGQMIPGRVIEVDDDYIYVDVGYKSEGKIPSNEFDTKPSTSSSCARKAARDR
jgi:small subunit ribosomal protein S1